MVTLNAGFRRTDAPELPPAGGYSADDGMTDRMFGRGAAEALNHIALGQTMIAAYLSRMAAQDAARGAYARGYNPDEPRDWHGRWTTGGARAEAPGFSPRGLYGGHLFRIQNGPGSGIGDNQPPEEESQTEEIRGPEPFGELRVPQGWDIPAHTVGGLQYPAIRRPLLGDGTPWPLAAHDQVKSILALQKGIATMVVFVPRDGVGPLLVGSTATAEFRLPSGYDAVVLRGTPQATYSKGSETGHAYDSIDEALRLAGTNQFSTIFFNRSFSTVSDRVVQSLIRPDVTAVARPQFSIPFRYRPYESFSEGQTAPKRQNDMPNVPGIAQVEGRGPSQWKTPQR